MPAPTMPPMTSMVTSNRPSCLARLGFSPKVGAELEPFFTLTVGFAGVALGARLQHHNIMFRASLANLALSTCLQGNPRQPEFPRPKQARLPAPTAASPVRRGF